MFRSRISTILLPLLVVASLLFLASCEKEVHINLDSSAPKVVVQGAIETGLPPYVVLTSSFSFFSKVDLSTLENSFLHGADVKVSDGSRTVSLKEYSFDTGSSSKFYVYSIDTTNLSSFIFGQNGKIYTLTVTYGGSTYTSVTKIPNPKGLDSVWFGAPVFKRSSTPATAYQLFCTYSDPDTLGDYVRYFTQRNSGEQFLPSGIFSDEVINGKVVSNLSLFGGEDPSRTDTRSDSVFYFFPGDTVTLKWSAIDKGVYDFYNTLQFAESAVGNPFASPINVKSNISNGGLGVWAGYGTVLYTRIVPQ